MKITEVEKYYQYYKACEMKEGAEVYTKEIYDNALNNPNEKKQLIYLFNQETNLWYKLYLADILAKLNVQEIIPFLVEYLKDPSAKHKTTVAYALLEVNYEPVVDIFLNIAEDPSVPRHWIDGDLFLRDTPLAHHVLMKLIEKHKDFRDGLFNLLNDPEELEDQKRRYEARKSDPTYPF